jgi:hypothetical protein
MYQMAIQYTKNVHFKAHQNKSNWYFLYEKIPSGNPGGGKKTEMQKKVANIQGQNFPIKERMGFWPVFSPSRVCSVTRKVSENDQNF